MLVSGDGTAIYPRGSGPVSGLRITLGAIPSAAFFDLPPFSRNVTDNPPFVSTSPSAACSIDYIANNENGGPNFPATATGTGSRVVQVFTDIQSLQTTNVIVDFLKGDLLSYQFQQQLRHLNSLVWDQCGAIGRDWSSGTLRLKESLRDSAHSQVIANSLDTYSLPNGSFRFEINNTVVARPVTDPACSGRRAFGPDGLAYLDLEYSYQGFEPCPPMVGTQYDLVDVGISKQRLVRALTDRSADAVYSDAAVAAGTLQFRGETIGSYVADTSPIGEVFLATSDLSILVHEPKAGNMPVLTRDMIPSGIVKLLAAIWL